MLASILNVPRYDRQQVITTVDEIQALDRVGCSIWALAIAVCFKCPQSLETRCTERSFVSTYTDASVNQNPYRVPEDNPFVGTSRTRGPKSGPTACGIRTAWHSIRSEWPSFGLAT